MPEGWFRRWCRPSVRRNCSCAWGDAACIVPWNVYLFSGDATILEQQFDSMKAWVDYIRKVDGEHHGWRHSFHYGDWLALDRVGAAAGNVYGATDEGYIADIYYAASAELTAKAAAVLGRKEEEKQYREIAEKQWRVVKEEYFTRPEDARKRHRRVFCWL